MNAGEHFFKKVNNRLKRTGKQSRGEWKDLEIKQDGLDLLNERGQEKEMHLWGMNKSIN